MNTHCGNNGFPQSNQKRRILFQGAPSVKTVKHYTHPGALAEVTPLVVIQSGKDVWGEDELRFGLVLQCTPFSVLEEAKNNTEAEEPETALSPFEVDTTFSAWSNPTRWWRALQLLEAMPVLDHRNLGLHLWIATDRPEPDNAFDHRIIEELCSTFAEGYSYEEIMARPIPLEIVQLTIRLVDEGLDMYGALYDLTNEIEAGTIRWSQELKRIGVSHPDYRRAVQAARAVVVERYRNHLFSYAAYRGYSYEDDHNGKAFIMVCIESCIYAAIECGIEQQHGMDVTAMLSILHEEITSDDIWEDLEKKHPSDRAGREPYVRPDPEEHVAQVITWMTEHFTQAGPLPPREELNQRLHRLHAQWDTMPIIRPLVS